MIVRIGGSALATGPLTISACKMLHSIELPILAVSIFRYIAFHFEAQLASTVYMVGVSFGHSLGLAILSPIAGKAYDLYGFPATYMMIAAFALTFWLLSLFALSPTPPEVGWRRATGPGPIVPALGPPGDADVEPAHGAAR